MEIINGNRRRAECMSTARTDMTKKSLPEIGLVYTLAPYEDNTSEILNHMYNKKLVCSLNPGCSLKPCHVIVQPLNKGSIT